MKIIVDELPSHPDECIFSNSYWDFDFKDYVYTCNLSKSPCNCPGCNLLEVKKDED